jgi:pimeloyl-[acyl-carrier protein] synthase
MQAETSVAVDYNPLLPEHRRDPYPFYRALREEDPVHFHALLQGWIVTRHADVAAVLRGPRFSADRSKIRVEALRLPEVREELRELAAALEGTMLFADPPAHTRLRHLVSKAFTPRVIEDYRERILEIVEELLAPAQSTRRLDVIRDLAYPLPVTIIAEILGVPAQDQTAFKRWSDDLAVLLDPFVPADVFERAQQSALEMSHYLRGVFAQRRQRPRGDLISRLVLAEERGDLLSESELFAICALLLGGGHETTTNLIGNGVLTLLTHPRERRRLQEDPALIETAVDELLRYESPVQFTGRTATADCELGGKRIATGDFLVLGLGAANRDPMEFSDPDRLDIGRRDNRHLAFSSGIHACLGGRLAVLEAGIAITTLLRRFPDLRPELDEPQWHPAVVSRGLTTLPVCC